MIQSTIQTGLVATFERELDMLTQQITQLTTYRTSLVKTIDLHKHARGLCGVGKPRTKTAVIDTVPVEETGPSTPQLTTVDDTALSTLDMARTVIKNAGDGEVLSAPEIRSAIKRTYGIEPAKTLEQMLYKASQKRRGFYKTDEGKYGLPDDQTSAVSGPVAVPTLV